MMAPRVSILMAAYNVDQYIDDALQSVLAQSMSDFEVIVVDDGSTDRTRERVLAYRDPRIRLMGGERQRGPSHCRNTALSLAEGEFVAVLDADDWWSPDRLEKLLELAARYQADFVSDNLWLIDDGAAAPWSSYFDEVQMPRWEGKVTVSSLATKDFGALKPLMRRSWLVEPSVLRFRETISVGEDYEFMMRCLARRPVMALTSRAYYFYRRRRGSLVSDTAKSLVQLRAAAETMSRELELYPGMEWVIRERIHLLDQALAWQSLRDAYHERRLRGVLARIVQEPALLRSAAAELPRWMRRVARRHSISIKETPSFSGR
ncbi:MAG: glycosyltransferase [Firmicutes bacterium]|nr:glycosyltransferase [Bacillota bacterium]